MIPAGETTATGGYGLRSLGRHSMIYGLGMLLTKAVSFVMLPVYTRLLSPADYGVIQLITMTFEVVTILAGSRIAWGIFHYYHKAEDDVGRSEVLSTSLLLLAATFGLAAAAASFAAPAIASLVFGEGGRYVTFTRIAAASMAFESLSLVPLAVLQLHNRSQAFVIVSLIKLALQLSLNLLFLIPFRMGVLGVLLSALIANALVGAVLTARTLATVGVRFRGPIARDFVRFGVPLMAMQVATFIVTFGDRYFLNRASSTVEVGLYGLAYQFGFLVVTIGFAPFQRVWDPQRFAVAKRDDRDAIFAQVFIYMNVLLVSAAVVVAVFAGDVLRIIAAPDFHAAAAFVPLLAAAYVFHAWGNFLNLGIFVSERTEYFALANWIAAGVALAGYVLLIPTWLAWGATITTFVALAVRCALAHVFSQRLWRVEYRWGPIVRLLGLGTVTATVSTVVPTYSLPVSVAIHTGLCIAYTALLWRLPILTAEQRNVIVGRLRRALRARNGTVEAT